MATALTTTTFVNSWLAKSQEPRILHVFERTCNLINEDGEIVSLILPEIGAGPFALIVAETRPFTAMLSLYSPISVKPNRLQIGDLRVDLQTAVLWEPLFNWGDLRKQTAVWQAKLAAIEQMVTAYRAQIGEDTAVAQQRLELGLHRLLNGIQTQNLAEIEQAVLMIAGLGRGLTPAGDDVLVGVIYGLWATQPGELCRPFIDLIVETAVLRTTALSAAWLQAAQRGQANELWHEFGKRLMVSSNQWQLSVERILETGHSSGADALWGFLSFTKTSLIQNLKFL